VILINFVVSRPISSHAGRLSNPNIRIFEKKEK